MKKRNLLKNKPRVYELNSSKQEAYEMQFSFRLKVVDYSKMLETNAQSQGFKDEEELLQKLFCDMRNYKLSSSVFQYLNPKYFCVHISIKDEPDALSAKVKINRRRVWDKICDIAEKIVWKIFGI